MRKFKEILPPKNLLSAMGFILRGRYENLHYTKLRTENLRYLLLSEDLTEDDLDRLGEYIERRVPTPSTSEKFATSFSGKEQGSSYHPAESAKALNG